MQEKVDNITSGDVARELFLMNHVVCNKKMEHAQAIFDGDMVTVYLVNTAEPQLDAVLLFERARLSDVYFKCIGFMVGYQYEKLAFEREDNFMKRTNK